MITDKVLFTFPAPQFPHPRALWPSRSHGPRAAFAPYTQRYLFEASRCLSK